MSIIELGEAVALAGMFGMCAFVNTHGCMFVCAYVRMYGWKDVCTTMCVFALYVWMYDPPHTAWLQQLGVAVALNGPLP